MFLSLYYLFSYYHNYKYLYLDQILLFVTDGGNSGGNPLEVIRDENQALQNRVLINTYGLGTRKCMTLTVHK